MQQELDSLGKIKRFPLPAKMLCWALCAACMAVIFWFSSRTAAESSAQSDIFLAFFQKLFGNGFLTDFIVRKSAHFAEFAGLGFLFALAFYIQCGKTKTRIRLCRNGRDTPDLRCRQSLQNSGLGNRHCRRAAWRTDPVCPAVCNKQSKKEKGCAN